MDVDEFEEEQQWVHEEEEQDDWYELPDGTLLNLLVYGYVRDLDRMYGNKGKMKMQGLVDLFMHMILKYFRGDCLVLDINHGAFIGNKYILDLHPTDAADPNGIQDLYFVFWYFTHYLILAHNI